MMWLLLVTCSTWPYRSNGVLYWMPISKNQLMSGFKNLYQRWQQILVILPTIFLLAIYTHKNRVHSLLIFYLITFEGASAHHMLVSNGADYKLYKKRLEEIKPLLTQLANSSAFLNHQSKRIIKILWLNQFPTIDFWAPIHGHNDDIYAGKIHQYSSILKSVLR